MKKQLAPNDSSNKTVAAYTSRTSWIIRSMNLLLSVSNIYPQVELTDNGLKKITESIMKKKVYFHLILKIIQLK